jgi:hypothetical protein
VEYSLPADQWFFRLGPSHHASKRFPHDLAQTETSSSEACLPGDLPYSNATNPEWLTGYAVLDDDGIKYLMFDLEPAPTSDFGPSGATNSEEERNRLLKTWHDDVGPKILAAIFAAENVKLALESEGSPQAQAVRHCCELLSESVEALNRMLSGKLLSAEDRSDALTFRDTKSPN